MIIRDKQELKHCIKHAVRRAQVVETELNFDVADGALGVGALLETWAAPSGAPDDALRRACAGQTPFGEDAAAMFAALNALELPTHHLNNAQTIVQSYDRNAYLREVLDAMRARRVLVRMDAAMAEPSFFDDDRFSPLPLVNAQFFAPGRYGVDYHERAQALEQMLAACSAKDIAAENCDMEALRYCLSPLCEDTGVVLHLSLVGMDMDSAMALLTANPRLHAVVSCETARERTLIDLARGAEHILVRLGDLDSLDYALARLGTRVIPYTSRASLPEQMLGRWEMARERIWQTLLNAYLPLARSGYELTQEAITRDVAFLLGGNLDTFYGKTFE